ncbi:hypothetical protein B0H14DRAFT_2611499 [Mycena olivaceomarginata]|nr:hypothetical protein B0H14DRAFT_2611499 [Mycena olivaceomarginata]
MPSVCLDGLTVRTLSAMDRTSAARLRRLRHPPPAAHQSPGRLGLRAVSSRQMPTTSSAPPAAHRAPVTWALGSARRVLPSDAQCVLRWVDSPDFGRRVAMDHTSARRVLPSDAQCVPRWVDSLDLGCRVAVDRTYDTSARRRLRRLRHPPPTAHQSPGRLGLRAVSFCQMPIRILDAVLPWTIPLRAVSSRQMPSVCLDGSTVWTLDAMLPWTVPMRAVSSRQMPTTSSAPHAAHRAPVTWALGSARRVLPSDAQCVLRWVDSPDFGRRVAMDHTSARRVLPSDAQCVPRWVDSPDFGRRVAMDHTSARRVLPSDAQCVPRWVDSLDLGCRVAVDRTYARRVLPSDAHYVVCATRRPPVTWALGSARRVLPSDAHPDFGRRVAMDHTSARRVLPSDAQCVPRWVDSLDLGCHVAVDRTYARRVLPSDAQSTSSAPPAAHRAPVTWALGSARRVLPSDAQCVPRWVDSLDLGCRVAVDRTYARRVLPSDAHYVVCATRRPPVTWALGSARRVLPSDAQCVPRWVDSPDFGRRVAMDHTSARRVLPSDAQCVPRWVDSPDFGRRVVWTVPLRAVSSRQMPIRTLDALFVITPGAIDVADDTRLDCCLVHIYSINESIRLPPTRPIAPPRAFFAANPRLIREHVRLKGWARQYPSDHGHVPHLEPAKYRGCKAYASHQSPHAKIYGILAIPTLRSRRHFNKDSVSEKPDIEVAFDSTIRQEKGIFSTSLKTHALARESQFSFLLFGFETPKNSHLDSYYENVLRDNLYNVASDDAPEIEDPMKPALDQVTEAVVASLSGEARAFYDRELGIGISTISVVTRLGSSHFSRETGFRPSPSRIQRTISSTAMLFRSKSATRSTRRKVYPEVGGVWYLGNGWTSQNASHGTASRTYNKSPGSTMGSLKKEDEADPSASIKSFRTGPFLTLAKFIRTGIPAVYPSNVRSASFRSSSSADSHVIKPLPPRPSLKSDDDTASGAAQRIIDEIASTLREWHILMF